MKVYVEKFSNKDNPCIDSDSIEVMKQSEDVYRIYLNTTSDKYLDYNLVCTYYGGVSYRGISFAQEKGNQGMVFVMLEGGWDFNVIPLKHGYEIIAVRDNGYKNLRPIEVTIEELER